MSDYRETVIWRKFCEKVKAEQDATGKQKMVEALVEKASQHLDRIIETFPTYTLHNRDHSLNVLRLMGKLLGPDVEKLAALEGEILIQSSRTSGDGMKAGLSLSWLYLSF